MFKEKLLKIFLANPLLDRIALFFVDIFIKKLSLKKSIKLAFSFAKNQSNNQKFNLENPNWLIWIAAPSGGHSKYWGDTYFAQEVVAELRNSGNEAQIIFRDEDPSSFIRENTILLTLRGLLPMHTNAKCLNLIWVISHPNQISKRELKKYDQIFAASESWASLKSRKYGLEIHSLLQATNPKLFNLTPAIDSEKSELLFVGNTRGKYRESVRTAIKSKLELTIIGSGWDRYLPEKYVKRKFVSNEELSGVYKNSTFVLADHWSDMAKNGFISNRLFDAVASGARVISDYVAGSKEIFGTSLVQYKEVQELEEMLKSDSLIERFGSDDQIKQNAILIQSKHNFQTRVKELLSLIK